MWPLIGGIASSLLGGLLGRGEANTRQENLDRQTALMEREQKYRFARQALLDPLFKEMLQRNMMFTRSMPMFGGMRGAGPFASTTAPMEHLPMLPKPGLIGEEPQPEAPQGPPQGLYNDWSATGDNR